MIIGGAVGNLLDRLFRSPGWFRGGVIDFIDVQWWPIFNVADIAVTVGGALLILSTMLPARAAEPPAAGAADDGGAGDGQPVADEHDVPDR